jgi:hypothetical protein
VQHQSDADSFEPDLWQEAVIAQVEQRKYHHSKLKRACQSYIASLQFRLHEVRTCRSVCAPFAASLSAVPRLIRSEILKAKASSGTSPHEGGGSGDLPLRSDEICSLTVTLPTQTQIYVAAGIVRWVRGEEFGLETLVMDDDSRMDFVRLSF